MGLTGKIVKGIAGFYYVTTVESGTYACRARGIFRKENIKPLVGDVVDIEVLDEKDREASLERIHPRTNTLVRPAAANIDQAMLIFALANPDPDGYLIDRFLISMEKQGIPVFLCFNKEDLASGEQVSRWRELYGACGYQTILCSAANGQGVDALRGLLAGKTTIIAGPSGVGKSTITNLLQAEVTMETGEISRKLGRGKHTTRHAELIALRFGGWICDTPGFSSLFLPEMDKEELAALFPEFRPYLSGCYFTGCAHINEPDCAVREALAAGKISAERYTSYARIYTELQEQEKRRY